MNNNRMNASDIQRHIEGLTRSERDELAAAAYVCGLTCQTTRNEGPVRKLVAVWGRIVLERNARQKRARAA